MTFQGSCSDMCPEAERQFRYGLFMSIFERDKDNQPDEYAMVKEYRRSSADQKEPESGDLRTPEALSRTMDYLVCNIMDDPRSSSQELAMEWYDFLWDRLRAIRKDITQQNICDQESVILVERCARFHVHSCYAMSIVKNFDVDMNKRNLNDCLQMLRQMYTDLKMTSGVICPGELEFQKYDILLHLNDDNLASTVMMKTSDYRSTSDMQTITNIVISYTNNDYYRFFQLMRHADYMTSCILSLYSNKMRLVGLKSIINACAPRQTTLYPVDLAVRSLGFDDNDDLKAFASQFDIEVQTKNGDNFLCLNKDLLQVLRSKSQNPFRSKNLVESKTGGLPVGLLVDGRNTMPLNPYRSNPISLQQPKPVEPEPERSTSMEFQEESFDEDEPDESSTFEYEQQLPAITKPKVLLPATIPLTFSVQPKKSITPTAPRRPTPPPMELSPKPTPTALQISSITPTPPKAPTASTKQPESIQTKQLTEPDESQSFEEHKVDLVTIELSSSESNGSQVNVKRDLEMKARQKEIADIMPAGRYKIRSLNAKVPTLRMPSMTNGHHSQAKKSRVINNPQRKLESMIVDMQDESRINEMTVQLLAKLGSNVESLLL